MISNLEALAHKIGEQLKTKGWMLTTAESCTGGLVAETITSVSGSSNWFERGFVTYSNVAKQEMLGVKASILEEHGAVSEQTVKLMAEGALKHSKAQISLAITGVAGPDGGTVEKPVGTVWFALAHVNQKTRTCHQRFTGTRQAIRKQATMFVLQELISFLSVEN